MRPSILAIVLILPASLCAQDTTADAVTARLRHHTALDAGRVDLLNQLAAATTETIPDSAIAYGTAAQDLAERLGYDRGEAEALKNVGYAYLLKEEYLTARSRFQRAMDISVALGDAALRQELHHHLGSVAEQQSDFPEALEHYLSEMRLLEKSGDSSAIAQQRSTIGSTHDMMGNSEEAARWLLMALRTYEGLHDSLGLARTCNNLGTVYDNAGDTAQGIAYLTRALELAHALKNPMGEAICLGSLANHYQRLEDYEQALKYDWQVIALFERLGSRFNEAAARINTGEVLFHLQRYPEARDQLHKGIALAQGIGAKQWLTNAHQQLYQLAAKEGDNAAELEHYRAYITYRDSITNEANTRKAVQEQMQYDFEKKEAATQAEQEKKDQRARLVRNGIAGGLAFALIFLGVVWRQRNKINVARRRSDELLLNILPEEVAEELKAKGEAEAVHIDMVTVLFTDFKGFTAMSETMSPRELVRDLNECFSAFDRITEKYGIEKIKTIGDAYMAAGGLPTPNTTHAVDVINAALEMRDFIAEGKARKVAAGLPYFEIRIGIHTGPVVAGIVGVKKFQYDIWGDTVNTASRMESSGEVGQVNISEATYRAVNGEWSVANGGSTHSPTPIHHSPAFQFTPRGKVQAKGKGEMEMYFVAR